MSNSTSFYMYPYFNRNEGIIYERLLNGAVNQNNETIQEGIPDGSFYDKRTTVLPWTPQNKTGFVCIFDSSDINKKHKIIVNHTDTSSFYPKNFITYYTPDSLTSSFVIYLQLGRGMNDISVYLEDIPNSSSYTLIKQFNYTATLYASLLYNISYQLYYNINEIEDKLLDDVYSSDSIKLMEAYLGNIASLTNFDKPNLVKLQSSLLHNNTLEGIEQYLSATLESTSYPKFINYLFDSRGSTPLVSESIKGKKLLEVNPSNPYDREYSLLKFLKNSNYSFEKTKNNIIVDDIFGKSPIRILSEDDALDIIQEENKLEAYLSNNSSKIRTDDYDLFDESLGYQEVNSYGFSFGFINAYITKGTDFTDSIDVTMTLGSDCIGYYTTDSTIPDTSSTAISKTTTINITETTTLNLLIIQSDSGNKNSAILTAYYKKV